MSVSYSQHPMPHQGSPSTYSTCPNFPIPLWDMDLWNRISLVNWGAV